MYIKVSLNVMCLTLVAMPKQTKPVSSKEYFDCCKVMNLLSKSTASSLVLSFIENLYETFRVHQRMFTLRIKDTVSSQFKGTTKIEG